MAEAEANRLAEAQTKDLIEKISKQGAWKNTKTVFLGGVEFSVRDVLITAPLIAGLNVYFIGGTGEGKTQLANDLAGLFGRDAYCYAEGRPDFDLAELLKEVDLGGLKQAKSSGEIIRLTQNVRKSLFYVDELNRTLPMIQNYFFNFFDGKLTHQGQIYPLGQRGYSVGFASGNIGDGAYVGVQDSDRALKDRMHLIVKLDYPDFHTAEEDDGELFEMNKNPRASLPEETESRLEEILELHKRFKQREIPLAWPALGIYFHKGLDYLEQTAKHSKRAVDAQWPNINAIRTDNDESAIMPLSKRAVFGAMALGNALQMIAESRGREANATDLYLDTLRLTVPYSGVLSPQYVATDHSGDVYSAFDAVMVHSRNEIKSRLDAIEAAIVFALGGQSNSEALERISKVGTQDRWTPVRRYVEGLAKKPTRIKLTDEGPAKRAAKVRKRLR
ncbi:MAG: AAA family ATPase [DPANN group archaeon]|nr:AAA family ATPase [DPANN group archaeon]